jgi:hypothetical protein
MEWLLDEHLLHPSIDQASAACCWRLRQTNAKRASYSNTRKPHSRGRQYASIQTRALNGRFRGHSGHCSTLAMNASVANDPTATVRGTANITAAIMTHFDVAQCANNPFY